MQLHTQIQGRAVQSLQGVPFKLIASNDLVAIKATHGIYYNNQSVPGCGIRTRYVYQRILLETTRGTSQA